MEDAASGTPTAQHWSFLCTVNLSPPLTNSVLIASTGCNAKRPKAWKAIGANVILIRQALLTQSIHFALTYLPVKMTFARVLFFVFGTKALGRTTLERGSMMITACRDCAAWDQLTGNNSLGICRRHPLSVDPDRARGKSDRFPISRAWDFCFDAIVLRRCNGAFRAPENITEI